MVDDVAEDKQWGKGDCLRVVRCWTKDIAGHFCHFFQRRTGQVHYPHLHQHLVHVGRRFHRGVDEEGDSCILEHICRNGENCRQVPRIVSIAD